MNRRTLLIAGGAGAAALTVVAVAVVGAREPVPAEPGSGPVVVAPTPPTTPLRPAPLAAAAQVRWEPGPWGEVVIAGHRLLLPASATDGPLRDRGDGWSSDYTPTATGAAIAVLRGPWLVFAAPATLRPTVVDSVLTKAAAADPGPVNPQPGWAMPPDVLAGFAGLDLRTLGATATLTSPTAATVQVYLARTYPSGTSLVRTTHHVVRSGRAWLIDADYTDAAAEPLTPAQLPDSFTITAPDGGE